MGQRRARASRAPRVRASFVGLFVAAAVLMAGSHAPARAQDALDGGIAPAADADVDAGSDPATDAGQSAETGADAAAAPATDGFAPLEPASSVSADESGWGDEIDTAGFAAAEAPPVAPSTSAPDEERGELDASGYFAHRVALWSERFEGEPFAQARQSVDLALRYKRAFIVSGDRILLRLVGEGYVEYDFAYRHARDRFDQPTLDAYESNVIGRESYAALSWGALELTFGRQIVPFGQGILFSPLDIVNPRDTREPGLKELDDARMAVLASRAGLFFGTHRVEALVVHESYFGLRPAPLSDFSPLRALILDDPRVAAALQGKGLRYDHLPGRFIEGAGQVYGRYGYSGRGVDLALYAGSTLDKPGIPEAPARAELAQPVIPFRIWHPRYAAFGHAGALPVGSFVLRWELGFDLDRPLAVQLDPEQVLSLGMVRRHQLNGLLGLTYSGIADTLVWLEYAQRVVLDNPERDESDVSLFSPVEAPAIALRIRHTFLRERWVLTAVGSLIGIEPFVGALARAELEYELVEALHIGLGYAMYFPSATERGPFYGFDDHDRLYVDVRWDFALE